MAARKQKDQKDEISELSFEEAIKELTNIVSKIEQGQIPLQDSLQQYEKGMDLIKHCRAILQKAEMRIEKITKTEAEQIEDETPTKDPKSDKGDLF